MSKAGRRLIEAAREAAATARGEQSPARMHIPADIDAKAIRLKLGLSQDDFASQYGFTVDQIRGWEQRRSRPLGGNRAYLMVIDRNPDGVRQIIDEIRREAA